MLLMTGSADYSLVTCSQRRLVCSDVYTAQTSRRYKKKEMYPPSHFGIVCATNW
jgi:hypothetical protein